MNVFPQIRVCDSDREVVINMKRRFNNVLYTNVYDVRSKARKETKAAEI